MHTHVRYMHPRPYVLQRTCHDIQVINVQKYLKGNLKTTVFKLEKHREEDSKPKLNESIYDWGRFN